MRIHMPEIVHDGGCASLRAKVEYAGCIEHLWYSVAPDWGEYLTPERCDAFVVALLPVAMSAGEDIHVAGTMSEKLLYNLMSHYMPILVKIIPYLQRINIVAEETNASTLNMTRGIAAGFSGGIDSFCLLADHLYRPVADGFKVTHLLFNNVGSHGKGGRRLFEERYRRLLPATRDMQLPFVKVDSNLDDILPVGFQLTHTLRNISVALVLQKLIIRFLYASALKYEDCFVGKTYDMAYADPMAAHLLSTETTECIATGSQYSRVEKTIRIADLPVSRDYLDVCVSSASAGNCSTCWKCARTLLTLEILGKLHLYDKVFDLAKYAQIRRNYVGKVLLSKDPLLREIRQLAREWGYRLPSMSRTCHLKKVMVVTARRIASKVVRRCGLRSIYARSG